MEVVEYNSCHYEVDGDTITNTNSGNELKEGSVYYNKVMSLYEEGNTTEVVRHGGKTLAEFPRLSVMNPDEMAEYTRLLESKLNQQQQRFCIEYVRGDNMGNGTRTYANVYDYELQENYNTCREGAKRLLQQNKVIQYIDLLIYKAGFNADSVDLHLSYLIHQQADFGTKLGAIKEYNKLQGRITDKMELNGNVSHDHNRPDYSNLDDSELEQLITLMEKAQGNKEVDVQ